MIKNKLKFNYKSIANSIQNQIKNEKSLYEQQSLIVHFFYFFIFFIAIQSFIPFSNLPFWKDLLNSEQYFIGLWCTHWIKLLPWNFFVHSLIILFLLLSFLGLLFGASSKVLRITIFSIFFIYTAFINSFGKIDHYLHLSLIVSFVLIFYSSISQNLSKIFKSIQLFILSTYTISGIFKFWGILDQLLKNEISVFNPKSLSYNLAKTVFNSNNQVYFQDFILHEYSYIQVLFLLLGYLIELLAIFIILKPQWIKFYGILLIALHLIIMLTIGPNFLFQIFIIMLFLILPYTKKNISIKPKL